MFKKTKLLYMLLIISFFVTACGTKDLTKGKSAQDIIGAAYGKMAEIDNYDMNLEMLMKMQVPDQGEIDMTMTGKATIFQKPMLMKMVMETNNPESGEPLSIEQYMESTENGMNIYQNVEGKWFKMSINDPALAEMMNMDPAKNLSLFLENLKEAKILGEEKVGERETVKIEMIASSEIYDEIMKQMPGMNLGQANMPFGPEILSKMGDMKYIIWIDKATLDMLKTSMDLTENIQNMGKAIVEQGQFPKEMGEVFSGMEMSASYEIYNVNKAEQVVIPDEAKNAQEMPLP
ncbi:MAG: hypothetical protein JM58_14440 [Peptococcaceae bacterium BICA1-8]|nr:MAG: hypothetical protein JM58_14440 [Peptococcaceae bacterium BICA1-8]